MLPIHIIDNRGSYYYNVNFVVKWHLLSLRETQRRQHYMPKIFYTINKDTYSYRKVPEMKPQVLYKSGGMRIH